jgi:dipeptidase E
MRDAIVASTSTLHGEQYLEYLLPVLEQRLHERGLTKTLFIPYARPSGISHDDYTIRARKAFEAIGVEVHGLHESDNPRAELESTEAIFTGGGNTFVLVKMLHDLQLMQPLRTRILNGAFYLGTSAGSNICGLTMGTTNDMPIVWPSSFQTTGILPYNINAHYIEKEGSDNHMGESRATRIKEFHAFNSIPVVGLKEGSYIDVQGEDEVLRGSDSAVLFKPGKSPILIEPNSNLNTINR